LEYHFHIERRPFFSRQRYRDIILESFQFCQKKKALQIGGYVIMSNHVQTIWTAGNANLSDVVRDFKTFTSKAILSSIEAEHESRRDWLRFYANRTMANKEFKLWDKQQSSGRNTQPFFSSD
jgi:REP element-mobilizing transposase RayT